MFDIIIIGGGPAGLAAAIYACRAKMDTLIIEQIACGGQINATADIENYPGSKEIESGSSLTARMHDQAVKFGANIALEQVISVNLKSNPKEVVTFGHDYYAKAIILATGATPAKIGCPGEEEFVGRGISYCATCDGAFFDGLPIYVVGGGDAAVEEAIYLTRFGSEVTVIHRRDELRAAKSIQEKAYNNPKIHFIWNSVVKEFIGKDKLDEMVLENVKTGELTSIKHDMFGVFVFVGYTPQTGNYENQLVLDRGYIKTDEEMQTAIPGVFAAGDLRIKSLRQVVTAVSDGAIAAVNAAKYVEELK